MVRRELLKPDDEGQKLEEKWVIDGTTDWACFQSYFFSADGLTLLFAPYEVGPYAAGAHLATVPFQNIAKLLRREMAAALRVEHL